MINSLAMRRVKSRVKSFGSFAVAMAAVLSVVLSMSGCTMWKEPKVATWKNTTSVEAMERLLWKEIQAGNWVEVEARLASNFTASTGAGVLDKQQMIARWKALPKTEVSIGEIAVTDNGETTVVTYNFAQGGGASGSSASGSSSLANATGAERRMSVWQKQKEGWVMIAHAEGAAAVAR